MHCFNELKTSNQILCCTNVIAATAILGVVDKASSLSCDTFLNTQLFLRIPRRNGFRRFAALVLRTCKSVDTDKAIKLVEKGDGCFCASGRLLKQNSDDC